MIILIYGEDLYQSENRLKDLKEKFKEKYGEINISVFEVEKRETTNAPKIISEIESMPFLGTKRLVIIKNLISYGDKEAKEKIDKKIENISESSIVIFFEGESPRKNDKLFKDLLGLAKVEEFAQKRGPALVNWITKEVVERGGEIDDLAAQRLAVLVGEDSLRLSQEIDKLINFCYPKAIKQEAVEFLISEKIQSKIFDLVDDLARRDGKNAIKSLHRLMSLGEKEIYLLSMMAFGFRNLILVKYASRTRENIKLPLHPYVLQKTSLAAKSFSYTELKKIFHKLVLTSLKIRETNNDPILVLDLLVSDICLR